MRLEEFPSRDDTFARFLVGASGDIVDLNHQAEQLFGYSREELVGKPVETLIPMRFRVYHRGLRDAFGAAPKERPMGTQRYFPGLRKNGTEITVEIALEPVETATGTYTFVVMQQASETRFGAERCEFCGHLTALHVSAKVCLACSYGIHGPCARQR